jgi:general secretion pathway protein D
MSQVKKLTAILGIALIFSSCVSFNAFNKAKEAEQQKNWDDAVVQYEQALEISPANRQYQIGLSRAKLEASRVHFEKGKTLAAAACATPGTHPCPRGIEQLRLAQLASTELQLTVKLDSTNQYAVIELSKVLDLIQTIQQAAAEQTSVDDVKKRAQAQIGKAQPPQLNPASNEPITLTFSRDTPVKDIYRALGNAFGINILFDQAVKDDRITIDLHDVTAQTALERVMQAANHFYKVLDEKTIIVVPDNPQARRDYEDLVIQTFYLSNGDAEQVTNVVRTMIEARNVFPLKALNAITIRDTADKVRIAEKIISANDKAKAEVVVDVELVQLDLNKMRNMGMALSLSGSISPLTLNSDKTSADYGKPIKDADGKYVPFAGGTLADIANSLGDVNALRNGLNFAVPTATYALIKTVGNSELLANPELRISEGEKATLHIGSRIPVPVTTISGYTPGGTTGGNNNLVTPYTSFQYQDVGIKVGIEPRVHHNREVTLKLTVEVSNQGTPVTFQGQEQPTFATRTIESTIRLKDGETNFLAGLIQSTKTEGNEKTPFLGDLPFVGRLFTKTKRTEDRTDLILTMTPHIIRIPDITEEDLAPMWVGTGTNLTFRGVSPRIESQGLIGDPFASRNEQDRNAAAAGMQLAPDGEPGNYVQLPSSIQNGPAQQNQNQPQGSAPSDPFNKPKPPQPQPNPNQPPPEPQAQLKNPATSKTLVATSAMIEASASDTAALRLSPRLAPQPASINLGPGETKVWNVIGMDLDELTVPELTLHFNPRSMDVTDVTFGPALFADPASMPAIAIDRTAGTIRLKPTNGKPLKFVSGGVVLAIRVHGGVTGETFLVIENPDLRDGAGRQVMAVVAGGRARVQ